MTAVAVQGRALPVLSDQARARPRCAAAPLGADSAALHRAGHLAKPCEALWHLVTAKPPTLAGWMHTTFLHLWKILWDEAEKTVPTCPARVPSIFMGDSRFHHGSRGQCFLGSSSGCLASRQGTTPFVYRPCHSRRTCRLASASLLSSPNSAASIRCRGTGTATSEPTPTELRHGNDSNQLRDSVMYLKEGSSRPVLCGFAATENFPPRRATMSSRCKCVL